MGSIEDTVPRPWAHEPIAIVGMSAKYGGDATTTSKLWQMLVEGRSGWSLFPDSRFRAEGVYHPDSQRLNSTHVKGAHFLSEDVGLFDAAFFGYSGETAASLDPQYRLQLESVYEALENGKTPFPFRSLVIAGSNTSVFTGVFVHDYRDGLLRDADNLPRLMATGTGVPMMANRVSHFFDFRGASVTIETACSSGMVAVHQAVQTLRTGEADMSIVGAANLTLNPDMFKALGSAGFLSADGKCYAFDSRASGYGRGEGVATLVLKRLSDALAAGDPIRAVIRESMVNQDGKTETITSPSLEAQERLVRGCYQKAGLDPVETQYFEAHGTGTQSGDTVEAQGIATVFAAREQPLPIGSIKTNIGHTEAASGLASLIKTALAMEKGVIPPSINFEEVNPKLKLDEWNLRVVREVEPWPSAQIRRASINNFGYGGTNSHIILEDGASWVKAAFGAHLHPREANGHGDAQAARDVSRVLVLSGKDEQACQRMVADLAAYLKQQPVPQDFGEYIDNLAYTLGERRTRFPWVAAHPIALSDGYEGLVRALQSPKFKPSRSPRRFRIGMVFTGQGAQWYAMGRELIEAYPVFRDALLEAQGYLEQFGADWSLIDELKRSAEDTRINEVALSTPICVAVQIALVRLLRDWGVVPVAVTSHSSGEIAAAYAVGALSYKSAVAFAYYRALLASDKSLRLPVPGGMIAVGLSLEETKIYLRRLKSDGQAVIACVNSPSSITVSGDLSAVTELEELANAEGVFARRLRVDTAWHSHHMTPIAGAYCEALERTRGEKIPSDALKSITFSSPVTGGRITDPRVIARPEHWAESMVQPVQFVKAFTNMVLGDPGTAASNVDVIIEVGPHTALGGPIQQTLALAEFNGLNIPYYGTLVRKSNARDSMQLLASNLLKEGYPVNLDAVNFPHGRHPHVSVLTDLPSYPWNHQVKHWVEPRQNRALRARSQPPHDLLGSLVEGSNPHAPTWRHVLRISESPWTRDHAIQSNIVYPAAGYICLAIEAVRQLPALTQQPVGEIEGYQLRDVDFLQALVIPDNSDGIEIQTKLRSVSAIDSPSCEWKEFEIWSVTTDNRWTQHAKGLVSVQPKDSSPNGLQSVRRNTDSYTRRVLPADLFANLRNLGIQHGPVFQNMTSIVQSGSEQRSIVRMTVPDVSVANDIPRDHVLHPVTLDSIITSPYSAIPSAAARETAAKVPRAVESLWISNAIGHSPGYLLSVDSTLLRNNDQGLAADVVVSDSNTGGIVLEMKGFSYQSLGAAMSLNQSKPWMHELCDKVHWSLDISIPLPATLDAVRKDLMASIADNEGGLINPRAITAAHIAALVRHLSHKNPRARILEVNTSQGAVAPHVLEMLGNPESGGPNASLYHFTDSSAASFENLREELLDWADVLAFDELDIQRDPATQGFDLGTYDIVIASGAEYAVEHTPQALSHIHSLLRPGGALLLGNTTSLSLQSWETQLQTTGFTGVSLAIPHNMEPNDAGPVTILSTASPESESTSTVMADQIVIVTSQRVPPPFAWLRELQDTIIARTGSDGVGAPTIQELESPTATAASYAGKICIFLGEADDAILYNLDQTLLEGIRVMSCNSRGVIWVTRGGAVDCARPEMSLASGFIRTLRTEYIGRKFVTLDLDPKGAAWSETSVEVIGEVVRATIGKTPDGLEELEYAERDGAILVPRIYHDVARNKAFSSETPGAADNTQASVEPFHQPFRPLSLQSESLVFSDDESADSRLECLPPASIELEPAVYLATLGGIIDHITSPAAAGIIRAVGEEAAVQGYSIGDRVVCILQNTSFPSRAIANWKFAVQIPSSLSFQEVVSLPTASLAAYYALVRAARLERDQSLLIHAAAGDIGQASIMLAKHIGAKVYATAGSPAERGLLISKYGLPAEHIFNSSDSSFSTAVLSTTQGRGVDVVLNLLTGELRQESLKLVAPLGHFIDINPRNTQLGGQLATSTLNHGGSITTVDIAALLEHRSTDVHHALRDLINLFRSGALSSVHPITTLDIGHIAEASTVLNNNRLASVVLSADEKSTVPVVATKATANVSSEASYLIVGGSGGLAQSTARWLVSRGAKNLVLVSRSAGTSGVVAALAAELIEAGCRRVLPISCDVANAEDLNRAIDKCAEEGLPPIRGAIHAAFVLRDALVEKMTLEDWKSTIESKVAGTWNLHNQFNLQGDLDFFVLFSSINGVLGYASQAAYSAAGAYEDALCHWRVNHCNLPAVSIDLSVVNAVGYVAEAGASESLRRSLLKAGRRAIEEEDVLAALESAILFPFDPQFIVGGINTGPGEHWNIDGDLGRDMRLLPVKYRPPVTGSDQDQNEISGETLAARISACASKADAVQVVEAAIAEILAEMFLVPVEDVDLSQSPSQQGVDSLVAVEVRKMLFSQAGAELSIFNVVQSPSLSQLAVDVVERSVHAKSLSV
ncbi:putative polyketide synthase [Aspergillus tetrazonus]